MSAPLIVLAGGSSRRMGRPKALAPFRGRPWIDAQLGAFARAGGEDAVVVIAEAVRDELSWAARALSGGVAVEGVRVRAIVQPRPEASAFSSLRLGLTRVSTDAFVLPVDVPIAPGVFARLGAALGPHEAVVPRFEGRGGHPVLLSASFAARVREMDDEDARLDRLLKNARRVDVPDEVVRYDLNTPEAWRAWTSSTHAARCYPPAAP